MASNRLGSATLKSSEKPPAKIALFVTCLVDLFRPVIGFASIKLLESLGCVVVTPRNQGCCGQPSYNSGDRATAIKLAKQFITRFEEFEAVIVPSGSCTAMVVKDYVKLCEGDREWHPRAIALSLKCFEITQFLARYKSLQPAKTEIAMPQPQPKSQSQQPQPQQRRVTYHDSCAGLRELDIFNQPRELLAAAVGNFALVPLGEPESCCGFGGTFCVKYPEISTTITDAKIANIEATGASLLLGGDLGCLLAIAGRLSRLNRPIAVRHIVECLAQMEGETKPLNGETLAA